MTVTLRESPLICSLLALLLLLRESGISPGGIVCAEFRVMFDRWNQRRFL
ncbi:hypothetical protein Mal52_56700 [Symmachiella dynata]|uniref:Uncharacterized protein n=1 Tax=Symmachiella dynata TaxID=2527995 RepID=A0A517ZXD1_9PLAN|nr:hypothetical protein Mal52_56700 [Symmachiella dynata]